jgi:AraC family transcriptional regulator
MRESTLRFYKERMLRVLVYIQRRLDEPLPLEELARCACLSPCHFHRVFRGMLGESVKSHIRRLRLERAATRLKLSRAPVIRIALEAGYETHEAFTRAFKEVFGLAPLHYRRDRARAVSLPAVSGVHYREDQSVPRLRTTKYGGRKMNVTIKQLPPLRVAFMRHVGPYSEVGGTWDKLLTLLGKEGLLGAKTQFIGICHDDPEVTPPDKIRYDACVTVKESFAPSGDIGTQTVPGGEYAVMTHLGPYAKLGESWAKLFGQWLPRSGREPRSTPCFEVYLNSPENTDPADLITDLYAPLEPKSALA